MLDSFESMQRMQLKEAVAVSKQEMSQEEDKTQVQVKAKMLCEDIAKYYASIESIVRSCVP